jgi:hypothetical protein
MVFSTKFDQISSTNTFLDGKTTHGHNQYTIFCNQMDSTILISNKPLTTNNIKSSTKPTCVTSSFLNFKLIEKNQKYWMEKQLPFSYWAHNQVGISKPQLLHDILKTFSIRQNDHISTCFFIIVIPLDLW